MAYKRITEDEFQIHGNYGQGFEELTCETTRKKARTQLRLYREAEPGIVFKMVIKRIKINTNVDIKKNISNCTNVQNRCTKITTKRVADRTFTQGGERILQK